MELVLELVGAEQQSTLQKSMMTFRQAGGTIGRAENATWTIVDRSRHVSGVHAEISYEAGQYFITDRSTNGTFDVNRNARLEKNQDYPIEHGDSFRLGRFVMKARIVQDANNFEHFSVGEPTQTPLSQLIPDDDFLETDPLAMLDEKPQEEDEPLLDGLLDAGHAIPDDDFALNDTLEELDEPFATPSLQEDAMVPVTEPDPLAPTIATTPELDDLNIANPVPLRPAPIRQPQASAAVAETAPATVSVEADRLIRLLSDAIDFDLTRLSDAELEAAVQNLGQIVRQSVQGLQQVLRSRADIKNRLRLGHTMVQESGNNPLKLSGNYQQTMYSLLKGQPGYLMGPQAVRQAMKDIQAHQVASYAASKSLMDSVFEQFSPVQLAYHFETQGKPSRWTNKDAFYWQQYQLHHKKMAADDEWRQSQFIKDYAKSYEEQAQYINAAWSEQ